MFVCNRRKEDNFGHFVVEIPSNNNMTDFQNLWDALGSKPIIVQRHFLQFSDRLFIFPDFQGFLLETPTSI